MVAPVGEPLFGKQENSLMRRFLKHVGAISAVAMIAVAGRSASANDLGLILNGDVETPSRFVAHRADHPNGFGDGWHHSTNAAWSNGTTDPAHSGIHSLWLPDDNAGGQANIMAEMRLFSSPLPVFSPGYVMKLQWSWYYDITSGPDDQFSGNIRLSEAPLIGLDLVGLDSLPTTNVFTTAASSGGVFETVTVDIPLPDTAKTFDIIFNTGRRDGDMSETGMLFVDDIMTVSSGDMNFDGITDFDDINDFVLGLTDPAVYESVFGVPSSVEGDIDMNGIQDFDDIPGFVAILTGRNVQSSVPEPSTLLLSLVGLTACGLGWWRRRYRGARGR